MFGAFHFRFLVIIVELKMLPTQVAVALQTDALPGNSLERVDQNQPRVFSLLPGSNGPNSRNKPRRKRLPKLKDSVPVMINPQISRSSLGVTLFTSHYRSTSTPESVSSFVDKGVIDDQSPSSKLHVDYNTYDANNNNINNHQIPSMVTHLNSSPILPSVQQTSIYPSDAAEMNSKSQSIPVRQTLTVNQLLPNNLTGRSVSIPSLQENEHNHLQSSFTLIDEGCLLGQPPSTFSSTTPISASETQPIKLKRSKKNSQCISNLHIII